MEETHKSPYAKIWKYVGLRKNVSNSLYHIVGPAWCPDISACCFDHVVFWLTFASYSHCKNIVGTGAHTPNSLFWINLPFPEISPCLEIQDVPTL